MVWKRLVLLLALASALPGCASSASADGRLAVVASTDVYGDLAARVGGPDVAVTSFISNPAQDPHAYEASAHDELALSRADVVIENGGGYDPFVDELLHAAGGHSTVISAVDLAASTAAARQNEHVWYDLPTVERLVDRLVRVFSAADPADAAGFRARGGRLVAGLTALKSTEAQLRSRFAGTGVAITEPLPLYLLTACGLINRTPQQFSSAIESGFGVPAAVLLDTLRLFPDSAVRVLVYNAQIASPETDRVIAAAKAAGIPAVPMTETLPAGTSYLSWMRSNLDALGKALR